MNKAELIAAVAAQADQPKTQVAATLAAITETIAAALKSGDKVALTGFGTFSVAKRAARKGRNPKTGKEMKIKASKSPKFKAGKTFKESI